LVLDYLPGWVEAMHCHFMRHVFWNSFPYTRRFFPQRFTEQERQEAYDFVYTRNWEKLGEQLFRDELVFELQYPDAEGLLSSEFAPNCTILVEGWLTPGQQTRVVSRGAEDLTADSSSESDDGAGCSS
jgi:hypothetical protein